MDAVDAFLKKILEDGDFPGLTPDMQAQMVEDMRPELVDQIDRAIINEMTEQQATEFAILCEQPDVDQAKIESFIVNTGINREAIAVRTMTKFREYYLGAGN